METLLNCISNNARGVPIFFKNNFEYKILSHEIDTEGNLLIIDLQIGEILLKIINIYGPNKDDPKFYHYVIEKIQSSNHDYLIWCGDFNMALNPTLDSYNYVSINNPKARRLVNNLI